MQVKRKGSEIYLRVTLKECRHRLDTRSKRLSSSPRLLTCMNRSLVKMQGLGGKRQIKVHEINLWLLRPTFFNKLRVQGSNVGKKQGKWRKTEEKRKGKIKEKPVGHRQFLRPTDLNT